MSTFLRYGGLILCSMFAGACLAWAATWLWMVKKEEEGI